MARSSTERAVIISIGREGKVRQTSSIKLAKWLVNCVPCKLIHSSDQLAKAEPLALIHSGARELQ